MSAIVQTSIEIKAPGNNVGDNGNWRLIIDASNNFIKQKRKAGSWDDVETDNF